MIRCREIATADLGAVADFLTHGFPERSPNYWMDGPQRPRLADLSDTELVIYGP